MIEIRHKETGRVLRQVHAASLVGRQMHGWQLQGADLRGADLRGAGLYHTDLSGADLEGASMADVTCSRRFLGLPPDRELLAVCGFLILYFLVRHFVMPLVIPLWTIYVIWRLILPGQRLGRSANMHSANLRSADLTNSRLLRVNLEAANLQNATLNGADLRSANLRGANLMDAQMSGADLSGADLRDADLTGADLCGPGVNDAILGGANLKGSRYDETTRWPWFFEPARLGCVTTSEVTPAPAPTGRGDEASPASPGQPQ